MKGTYYLQRKHINGTQAPPIKDLKSKWPYLFVKKHIYAHFEELTSNAIHKRLNQAIQEYGKVLVDFFKSKPTNDVVKKVLSSEEEEYRPLVIKLILAHFRDDPDGLLILANRCTTAADLQATHTIPRRPRLIVLGPRFVRLWCAKEPGTRGLVRRQGGACCDGNSERST
ncbi:unnamed protein product [Leuciscus chuanchicus]